jgi:hypothetical protein
VRQEQHYTVDGYAATPCDRSPFDTCGPGLHAQGGCETPETPRWGEAGTQERGIGGEELGLTLGAGAGRELGAGAGCELGTDALGRDVRSTAAAHGLAASSTRWRC